MSSSPRTTQPPSDASTSPTPLAQPGWMTPAQPMHRRISILLLQIGLGVGFSLGANGVMAKQASASDPTAIIPHQTPISPASSFALPLTNPLTNFLAQGSTETFSNSSSNSPSDNSSGEAIQDGDIQADRIQADGEARGPNRQGNIYTPIRLTSGNSIEDTLTTRDIPLGQGSFARDYVVTLKANDQIAIDLFSESFDTVVTLISENGTTLGENDDGPEGGTNSLLFMRITEDGDYVVRVRGFGQAKGGPFKLKLTRLQAVQ